MSGFSTRLPWAAPANAPSRLLDEKRAAGARLIDLTISNPTHAGLRAPPSVAELLAGPRALGYDPDPCGDPAARRAVAGYYAERGLDVDPERLILCASTSEAYSWLFKLLCDPGDEVLVPRPSYPLFDHLAALESVRIVHYPLAFDGAWHLDRAGLRASLAGGRARAIVAVSPNNPTGSTLKRDEVDALWALAEPRGLPLLVDEVFGDYPLDPLPGAVPSLVGEERGLCFTLSGLSKVLGLPQLKLAWIHVGGPRALAEPALARLELIADTYLSVSTPVAAALPGLLSLRPALAGPIASRLRAGLELLRARTAGTAATLLPVEGGWYAMLRLPAWRSDEEWALALLEEEGLVVQPGYFYDCPIEAVVVVSLLTPPADLDEGIGRLLGRLG